MTRLATTRIFTKIALLGALNTFSLWAIETLIVHHSWAFAAYFAASTGILDYVFLRKKFISAKYLVPGVVLLIAFQIYPAIYTVYIAFTNYSTGHIVSKSDAINQIESVNQVPVAGLENINMNVLQKTSDKSLVLLLKFPDGSYKLGSTNGLTPLEAGAIANPSNPQLPGYTTLNSTQENNLTDALTNFKVPVSNNVSITVTDFTTAQENTSNFIYDAKQDAMVNQQNGDVYKASSKGAFVDKNGVELEPGWPAAVGFKNFTTLFTDSRYRSPLIQVLWWTFTYPLAVVLSTFFLGLALALALNHSKLRSRGLYRSLLIIPYAMPNVLSVLVWAGMFNRQSGVINRWLHLSIPWLDKPWTARLAVLIVQLWLGTPYMFLIATGAIQSLSTEIVEAAEVDGASNFMVFRRIKLPLIVASLSPLLIASYAYNFSNFGGIFLLTGGGPQIISSGGTAGYTDILISYTYNLAFISGKGNQYGLASAVALINFFLIGGVSIYAFMKSKTVESIT